MSEEGTPPGVVVEALGVPIGIPVTGDAVVRLRRQWSRALTDRAAATVVDLAHLSTDDEVAHDYAAIAEWADIPVRIVQGSTPRPASGSTCTPVRWPTTRAGPWP